MKCFSCTALIFSLRFESLPSKRAHLLLYCHLQYHNDTINKQTQEDFFINICTSYFIVRFVCERELATEQKLQYFDPTLMAINVCLSRSPDVQPEALGPTLLGDGFLYCILSATSLDPNSIGGPEPLSAWCGFPYHISSITPSDL